MKKMKNKKRKGEYGYREYHRKVQVGKILFGIVMILVQLGARNFTDNQSAKNILTVMAVLSVLPTANVAAPFLAAWRYRTPKEEFYKKMQKREERYPILYDLIITSRDFVMAADAVAVHPLGVFVYCTAEKVDSKKAEKFLNEMFVGHKLDPHAKVIKDEKVFFQRLDSLKAASEYDDDGSMEYTVNLLKNLSM